MRTMLLGKTGLTIPVLAIGCMRLRSLEPAQAERYVKTAMQYGANYFDHADVYGEGSCESIFADAIGMNPSVREKIFLQSKCGIIRRRMHDFSREHILDSVDGILKRLRTEYLDVLLLHRPDLLVEPEEVAETFDTLQASGKVRHFGVSNHNPMQIQLLQKFVKQPIAANQLQLSPAFDSMISQGLHVNMADEKAVNRDGSILDFCRLHDITIQPWSPFQYGFFEGVYLDNPKFPKLNAAINALAAKYQVSNVAIVIAWLLRHPAHMQPVTGTMNLDRLHDCIKGTEVRLSREEWYSIYLAAGNILP